MIVHVIDVHGIKIDDPRRASIVYVGRRSCWAGWDAHKLQNPFRAGVTTGTLPRFREHLKTLDGDWLAELWEECEHGAKALGCWCYTGEPRPVEECHAEILANMLNARFCKGNQ